MARCPFGLQPARQHLYDQRWSLRRAADELDVSTTHLINALIGKCPPSPELRDRLPALLALPLTELFTVESLAKPYAGPRGAYRVARASTR